MSLQFRADRRLIRAEARSTRYLLARIEAPAAARLSKRPPVNLAFVLDRSGSMHGEKIRLAREAVLAAIRRDERVDGRSASRHRPPPRGQSVGVASRRAARPTSPRLLAAPARSPRRSRRPTQGAVCCSPTASPTWASPTPTSSSATRGAGRARHRHDDLRRGRGLRREAAR